MPRRAAALAKKSLVVEPEALDRLVKVGGYRNESEAVRAAVAEALAIRGMQDAIARLQRRGTFGRPRVRIARA
jgi:Arc/MetJ-type ribon-helix-helix transcriptional regulator